VLKRPCLVFTWYTVAAAYLVSVQDKDSWTPLMWAASIDHAECIQLLMEYVPKVIQHMMSAVYPSCMEESCDFCIACAVACLLMFVR